MVKKRLDKKLNLYLERAVVEFSGDPTFDRMDVSPVPGGTH